MKIIYNNKFNYDIGPLKYLHPFDGTKFRRVHQMLTSKGIEFESPQNEVTMDVVDEFLTGLMRRRVRDKNGILQALEVPRIPLVNFGLLDRRILSPMRWGVAGTLYGAEQVLMHGEISWNLSGGYHHAMQQNMEGFCIYNDIGISYQQLVKNY